MSCVYHSRGEGGIKMSRKKTIKGNIDIIDRKLIRVRDLLAARNTSLGQQAFINTYLGVVVEYLGKVEDIFDVDRYNEELKELDPE